MRAAATLAARPRCCAAAPSESGATGTGFEDDDPYGIDLPAVLAATDDLAARIERDGLADIRPADLRLGLTPG